MTQIEDMMQKITTIFDTTDEKLMDMWSDYSWINQKVDAHAVLFN